jgi:hypothetical protein
MAHRSLILAAGLFATLTLAACGSSSSNTCATVCDKASACDSTPFTSTELAACNTACNAETCTNKQAALDCVAALSCTATPEQGTACLTANGCSATTSGLNPAFTGTWNGPTVATLSGVAQPTYTAQLVVVVSGSSATVSRVCPDDTGTMTMSGSGNNASWTGTLVCPPKAFGSCAAVTVTFTSGTATLSSNNLSLAALGSGTATGCGSTAPVTFSFNGAKQ